jgi:hypothetical protein
VKVATVFMLKGGLASDFCSPALTWAHADADARVSISTTFANFVIISPRFSRAPRKVFSRRQQNTIESAASVM